MLLPLKPICERNFIRRDGTSFIYIQYCYSAEKRTLLNTEIAIPPSYWNKKKLCISNDLPPSFGNAQYFNEDLVRMIRLAEDIVSFTNKKRIENKGKFVKQIFKPDFDIRNLQKDVHATLLIASISENNINEDLFFQIDNYIHSKENKVCEGMLNVYRHMKEHLKAFEAFRKDPITFKCLDYNFYLAFIDFLTLDYVHTRRKEPLVGLKVNTIGQTIKQLRIFIKDRVRRKIIPPIDLTDFKIPDEETDAIYLNHEEIARIYQTDLSEFPYLTEYRDLFVLACLTGLRYSDFSTLKQEDLRENMLYKKQQKSDHWVVIPLRKEAKEIFSQQFKEKIPRLRNAEFNRHIKKIGNLAGLNQIIKFSHKKGNRVIESSRFKYEWITSHTARRSFCTNEFLAGTPVKLIMNISGHKTEKDFYKYIRITPEEAAEKIKDLWIERSNMEAFSKQLRKIS